MPTDNLLVTTSIKETWGKNEKVVFLGEWCKPYDKRKIWNDIDYEVVPFHWDDREKLKKDYDYLETLHHSLLKELSNSLNGLHHVEYPVRYWQILLDPWLMSYVGILFDRWECLRIAFERRRELKTLAFNEDPENRPPFSYAEFIEQAMSDTWNFYIYLRILKTQYSNRCHILNGGDFLNLGFQTVVDDGQQFSQQSLKSKLIFSVEAMLGKLFRNYQAVFLGTYFSAIPLIRLNISLRQIPRLFLNEFDLSNVKEKIVVSQSNVRASIKFGFQAKSDFENFLAQSIPLDLPSTVVESYPALREYAVHLPLKTKMIVTASSHWRNVVAKAWFAEQVAKGTKLVILEHGGSLPAQKELFDFEEDISDVRGSWFIPYHDKHRQIPPSRMIGHYKKTRVFNKKGVRSRFCSVIANENRRWVNRTHFYPMAQQCLVSVDSVLKLYSGLSKNIQDKVRIKPAPNKGWNTKQIFADHLGEGKIYLELSMSQVFGLSDLIICTYPETTFCEAMASGVPTVLIYSDRYYERHSVTFPLLKLLRDSRIVFHDPENAAVHINSIWPNPSGWWNSTEIIHVRKEFARQACVLEVDWLRAWKSFLKNVITDH